MTGALTTVVPRATSTVGRGQSRRAIMIPDAGHQTLMSFICQKVLPDWMLMGSGALLFCIYPVIIYHAILVFY